MSTIYPNIQNRVTITSYKESGKYYTHENVVVNSDNRNRDEFVAEVLSKTSKHFITAPTVVITPASIILREPNADYLYAVVTNADKLKHQEIADTVPGYLFESPSIVSDSALNTIEYAKTLEQKPFRATLIINDVPVKNALTHTSFMSFEQAFKSQITDLAKAFVEAGNINPTTIESIAIVIDDVEYGNWFHQCYLQQDVNDFK